ncbi:MAG: D-2-hydroxyacid dehydrogenase [Chloroflexota bacterium]|nr:D-2-hydroxyacid dehydrogenase [Chloroflexota bacterium]
MHIVVSPRVRKEYGARISGIAPGARLLVPSVMSDGVSWSGDVSRADVCCFSEDLWQEPELRQSVLPVVFRLDGLKWFHTFSAGVDSPVFQQLIDRGTILTNSSGASAPSIAQYVLAMMLHRVKRMGEWHEQQARREWRQLAAGELTGQTVGIIGTGAIGGEVARLAQAFGMRVLGIRRSDRRAKHLDEQLTIRRLPYLLKQSDHVVLACPLTKETEGLIGERELRAMKPDATLINVARGRVVDEPALVRALEEGWIGGACLDVFAQEPLPESSPLWSLPNVVLSPHNSGFSPLNMARSMAIFLDNLERFTAGKRLRNRVTHAGG